MKTLCLFALLILPVLAQTPGIEPPWDPIGIDTRTAIGAYNRVSREYEGRLVLLRLVEAYHKTIPAPSVLEGSNVKIIFTARTPWGYILGCTAHVQRKGDPWLIWYMRCLPNIPGLDLY